MTIIAQHEFTVSRSFPGGYATTSGLDHGLVVVGLVSLLGLCVSALVFASGVIVDFDAIAPFMG